MLSLVGVLALGLPLPQVRKLGANGMVLAGRAPTLTSPRSLPRTPSPLCFLSLIQRGGVGFLSALSQPTAHPLLPLPLVAGANVTAAR
eukprot:scaffold315554_cov28-Tisochrysis_lutea.AAC.1